MSFVSIKSTLNEIASLLSDTQDNREFLLKNTREIVIICSKAIIGVHGGELKTAKKNLKQANLLLKRYQKKATGDLRRYLVTPEQEYVEAVCLVAITEKKEIPTNKMLSVMPE